MSNPRSLWPREHGAYAELGFPILTGLTAGVPSVAAVALAGAAVALFLAHEPIAVVSGMRGERLRTSVGAEARRRAGALIGLGVLAGAAGLGVGGTDVRRAALIPIAAGLLLLPWVLSRRQKSIAGELVVILAFAATALPIALAVGAGWRFAWAAAAVWLVSFGLGTLAVHALKLRHKRGAEARWASAVSFVLAVLVAVAAGAGALLGAIPVPAAVAVVPPAILVMALAVYPVHPRRLKRVGWSLVAANVVTWICLLWW